MGERQYLSGWSEFWSRGVEERGRARDDERREQQECFGVNRSVVKGRCEQWR